MRHSVERGELVAVATILVVSQFIRPVREIENQ